jgi:hypothetical protein
MSSVWRSVETILVSWLIDTLQSTSATHVRNYSNFVLSGQYMEFPLESFHVTVRPGFQFQSNGIRP